MTSVTEESSPDEHGSTFTITMPIGKDHLLPSSIVSGPVDVSYARSYARGIVEEANNWSATAANDDQRTPSESSDSGGSSSEGSKMDPATLFFRKSDVILLGMFANVYCGMMLISRTVDDSADMRRVSNVLLSPDGMGLTLSTVYQGPVCNLRLHVEHRVDHASDSLLIARSLKQ